MNDFDLLQGWVSSLGRIIGVNLEFDENRVCTVLYGEDICLSLAPCEGNEATFIVAGPVMALTMDPDVDGLIFKAVLKMNFLGAETGCGVLGLSLYDGMIVFAHAINYSECDEILLQNVVQNVANDIERFRGQILDHLRNEAKSQSKVLDTVNSLPMYGRFV